MVGLGIIIIFSIQLSDELNYHFCDCFVTIVICTFPKQSNGCPKTKALKIASFWSCGEMGVRFKFLLIGYKALVLALVLANDNFVAIFFFLAWPKDIGQSTKVHRTQSQILVKEIPSLPKCPCASPIVHCTRENGDL